MLADTSVWVDHLRRVDAELARLLGRAEIVMHPFVVGEVACGSLANRGDVLLSLQHLPMATVADDAEVLAFIDRHALHGKGIGWVDAHLMASVALMPGVGLWTRDKRLDAAARGLGLPRPDAALQ